MPEKKNLKLLTEKNVQFIDLGQYSTEGVTDLSGLFRNCDKLERIDLSGFDTSSVESMANMFAGCTSLREIDLTGLSTVQCKNMSGMFAGCSSLKQIDLSHFKTDLLKDVSEMFKDCTSLEVVDLSGWHWCEHRRHCDSRCWFDGCINLREFILRGCDGYVIDGVLYSARDEGRRIKFTVDPLAGSLPQLPPAASTSSASACDLRDEYKKHLGHPVNEIHFPFSVAFKEDEKLVVGGELHLWLSGPSTVKIGDVIHADDDPDELDWDFEKCHCCTFQLQQILALGGSRGELVRAKVIDLKKFSDLAGEPNKIPEEYDLTCFDPLYVFSEGCGLTWNRCGDFTCVMAADGGGDVERTYIIISKHGIDHLIMMTESDFDYWYAGSCDIVLGRTERSPFWLWNMAWNGDISACREAVHQYLEFLPYRYPGDPNKFRFALPELAEQGDAAAQYALAKYYSNSFGWGQSLGWVVEKKKEVNEWYRKSAQQGYAPAQAELDAMRKAKESSDQT